MAAAAARGLKTMIKLENGNFILNSEKDVIEFGNWSYSLNWYGQFRKENRALTMGELNEQYKNEW